MSRNTSGLLGQAWSVCSLWSHGGRIQCILTDFYWSSSAITLANAFVMLLTCPIKYVLISFSYFVCMNLDVKPSDLEAFFVWLDVEYESPRHRTRKTYSHINMVGFYYQPLIPLGRCSQFLLDSRIRYRVSQNFNCSFLFVHHSGQNQTSLPKPFGTTSQYTSRDLVLMGLEDSGTWTGTFLGSCCPCYLANGQQSCGCQVLHGECFGAISDNFHLIQRQCEKLIRSVLKIDLDEQKWITWSVTRTFMRSW